MPFMAAFTPRAWADRSRMACVRLAPGNAATLYALVQKAGVRNTRVVVTGGVDLALADVSAPQIKKPKWVKASWSPMGHRAGQ